MNAATYQKECIPRLDKFIEENHNKKDVVFWPDLASAHYAKGVEELKKRNISTVPRASNPPAAPQIRPVEKFWALLKNEVYKDGWHAASADGMKRRI